MSELTINRCKICSLLALHFNKLDLCNFCRSILIFHNIYQLNNQNPKLKILQSTAPFNSTAPFDNRIMASTHLLPKQGYAIIFYYPNPVSTCTPFKNPNLQSTFTHLFKVWSCKSFILDIIKNSLALPQRVQICKNLPPVGVRKREYY